MAKSRVKKRVKKMARDCDFNNFATNTLKFFIFKSYNYILRDFK
jgi:hypothetical protein